MHAKQTGIPSEPRFALPIINIQFYSSLRNQSAGTSIHLFLDGFLQPVTDLFERDALHDRIEET